MHPSVTRPPSRLLVVLAAVTVLAALGGCSSKASSPTTLAVYVSAPVSTEPWVGRFTVNGATLAVDEINAAGGVTVNGTKRRLSLTVVDNEGSAQKAVDAARQAVAAHALALVTDGVGASAVAAVTDPAHLPVFVVYEGGASVVDAATKPTIFRIAPSDKAMAVRLADYVAARKPTVALIAETSSFGRDGAAALTAAFARDAIPVKSSLQVDPSATDLSPQITQAKASGADTLVVWARASVTVAALRAARQAGWQAPVFASPSAEDPLVRQQVDDHPEWLEGLTFVSFRITAEVGPKPFAAFRAAYEKRFGVEKVGVKADGTDVIMPPDWAMYSYDAVRLAAAAAVNGLGQPLMTAMETTVITGANGDERGFSEIGREGVSPDDMYFGRFHDKRFVPVTDDILSTHLPTVSQ